MDCEVHEGGGPAGRGGKLGSSADEGLNPFDEEGAQLLSTTQMFY